MRRALPYASWPLIAFLGLNFTPSEHHDTYPTITPDGKSHAGKVVLVTGASKGIGRTISTAFAQAGVTTIALAARSIEGLKSTAEAVKAAAPSSIDVLLVEVDVTDVKSVAAAAETLRSRFGRLDILVNNAGYFEDEALIADSDPSEWWKVYEVNVLGTYLVTRAFLPILLAGGDKTILNLSTVGTLITVPGTSAYLVSCCLIGAARADIPLFQSSKFANLRVQELLVMEYGSQGLLTYGIHPGVIPSDMSSKLPQNIHHLIVDTVELAAHTLVYLTKQRKEWLNGRYVSATWDVSELEALKDTVVEGDLLKMKLAV